MKKLLFLIALLVCLTANIYSQLKVQPGTKLRSGKDTTKVKPAAGESISIPGHYQNDTTKLLISTYISHEANIWEGYVIERVFVPNGDIQGKRLISQFFCKKDFTPLLRKEIYDLKEFDW